MLEHPSEFAENEDDSVSPEREGAAWLEAQLDGGELMDLVRADLLGSVSERAIAMLVEFEVTSRAVYERRYRRPTWPGEQSGVTIGIGYDVGYVDRARLWNDWRSVISERMIRALERAIGVKGPAARELARELADEVDVPWDAANHVFRRRSLPLWIGIVERALPNTSALSPDSLGALVSLTYNRGASYSSPGDRYREMRAIKGHMGRREFGRIPDEIRSMKRLWPNSPGLRRRRDREAELFQDGLPGGFGVRELSSQAASIPSSAEIKKITNELLQSLADAPGTVNGRRFFFPNGVGEIGFELSYNRESGFSLRVDVRDAEPAPASVQPNAQLNALLGAALGVLLTPARQHELIGRVSLDDAIYFLFDQFDEHAGGQLLINQQEGAAPHIIAADSVIFTAGSEIVETELGNRLAQAFGIQLGEQEAEEAEDKGEFTSDSEISRRVFESALACNNHLSSRNVPGTNRGRRACAWAVNEVVRRALGRPIGGGLQTSEMVKVLRRRHTPIEEEEAEPGTIIISPTSGGVTGHVGIVGERSRVYSNSSSRALFVQNYTFRSWRAWYEDELELEVLFFRLSRTGFSSTE
jgi:hypothetical protein